MQGGGGRVGSTGVASRPAAQADPSNLDVFSVHSVAPFLSVKPLPPSTPLSSVHQIKQTIVQPHDREKPRSPSVQRNRRKPIVEERMLDRLAGHAPRDRFSEARRH